jgi:molybdopterin molybdotransferase
MPLTTFRQALQQVIEVASGCVLPAEHIALESAGDRILAEDLCAPFAVPGFRHSAMDGYAIDNSAAAPEDASYRIVGQILAGDPPFRALQVGEAVAIATGAMLPDNASQVIPRESAGAAGDDRVVLAANPAAPSHIRGAEDDYRAGELALRAGNRLGFAALGVLASFGMSSVRVVRRPRVAVLVTGSELVPAGAPRQPGRIHDSNGASLRGLLRGEGIEVMPTAALADDIDTIRRQLAAACAGSDVVISTGGASAGVADFMPRLLAELGEVVFWKVAMRPGMPVLFGRVGRCLVFGLPGNPVAVVAGFLSLVRPVLRRMQGAAPPATEWARLAEATAKNHDRLEFRRAHVHVDEHGVQRACLHPALSSGVLRSVLESNALVVLDAERRQWQADELVAVLRYG